MRLSQAWIVATHDMGLFRTRRTLLYALVAFPLAVSIGFPLLVNYIHMRSSTGSVSISLLSGIVDSFSFWFVIAAATLPASIASYSIVGEKVEKSLEPLLATPTTDAEILLGKGLAAFLPTILAVWGSSVVYMALMDRVTFHDFGYLYFPNTEMAVILLLLAPLAGLCAIELSILVSSRVTDVRTAQQISAVLFLPFILLYLLGEVGVITLDTTNLLYIGAGLAVAVVLLFYVSRRTFHREEILTQWR
ncbi:MAG TPA: ABC transporter permease [Thermoplasmata archaeon]|nr:ABC transporter permease [Thermoplasmata archaeon]